MSLDAHKWAASSPNDRAQNDARSSTKGRRCLTDAGVDSSELITVALLLTFAFSGLDANLLVVLLESSKILTSLRELALLHTLTDVPVHESALGVHEIELMVDAGEDLSNGRGVAYHAHSAHHLREVTTRHDSWWLVVDAALKASGAPIHELNGTLGFDCSNRGVHV